MLRQSHLGVLQEVPQGLARDDTRLDRGRQRGDRLGLHDRRANARSALPGAGSRLGFGSQFTGAETDPWELAGACCRLWESKQCGHFGVCAAADAHPDSWRGDEPFGSHGAVAKWLRTI